MSPLPFTRFVADVLHVRLTPGQRVLALVAFDALEPGQLEGEDREIARQLFGDVDTIPPEARHVLVAVCGGRAGKSYVLLALRLLHLALTVPLSTLAPGEVAVALIVAPDLRLARQTMRYALGAAELIPSIRRCIQGKTADGFTLRRPEGGLVSLECLPATRGGSALRGRSLVGAALDECAFFRDESYAVNDSEIFKAVAPRVLQGGQVVIASTPWTEAGLLYDFHKRNHGHPVDAISAHAPTLLLRNDEHTRSYVAREEARDPTNARREFGAEFLSANASAFFDARAIDAAVDSKLILPAPRISGAVIAWGSDFGFQRNSSTNICVQRTTAEYIVSSVDEVKPEGGPLKPSVVVARFAAELRRFGSDTTVADGHYRQSIAEHLEANGMYLQPAPEGQSGKADVHMIARGLIHEGGRVRFPEHVRLIRQLKEVVSKPLPGGGVSISSPVWRTGEHGDLASACVLALWRASLEAPEETATGAAVGSPDWMRAQQDLREQALIDAYVNEQDNPGSNDWILGN